MISLFDVFKESFSFGNNPKDRSARHTSLIWRFPIFLFIAINTFIVEPVHSGEIIIPSFMGLNSNDNPVALEDGESQDLLNVGITPGGKSVYKREGYGLHKTLSFSTSAVHGLHYFQDLSGSDIQLYGHDIYLSASVNGAAPVDIATGTVNATWQCTDNSGFAYCVNSSRNTPVRTSGTTGTTTFQGGIPLGTMITNTPDRLVVAGVSGTEAALYFSQANTFTNFTTGINSADPFIEYINSPGSRITHIRYACGKLLWWKDGSFGYSLGSDQYNMENVTVSQNIGTLDNSSDEYNGNVYFRGQDNHIYQYDCSNVTRLSRKITPTVSSSGRRKANSWTQTSQSDWQAGVLAPSGNFSTTSSVGDLTVSSFSITDTASTDFNQGSSTNVTFQSGGLIISTNATTLANYSFETGDFTNWVDGGTPDIFTSITGTGGSCSIGAAQDGTYFASSGGTFGGGAMTVYFSVWDASTNVGISTTSIAWVNNCTWASRNLTIGSSYLRRKLKIVISADDSNFSTLTSDPFIATGTNITFYTAALNTCSLGNCKTMAFDNFSGAVRSTISTATYQSRVFDTGTTAPLSAVAANWTANEYVPYIELQNSSADTGPFTKITGSTGTTVQTTRYLRYISSFTVGTTDDALTTMDDVTVVSKSTGGVFRSAVNTASGITSWNTFGANDQTTGGSISYFVRASTGLFTINSSTPNWVSQSKNATVNYATGTYMQAMASFTVTNATATLSLSDFTFNWFEGASVDKAYIKYWNDYVWVAVSSGTSGLNNRIQRWDILNQTWLLDDIAANGFLVDNNSLYFGSPTSGKIYKYGNGLTTDDSGSINSYWKSKNFAGDDPFVQKNWDQSDFVVKAASPTIMSVIYQLDGSTTTTYSMNLYHPTKTILHKGVNLSGRIGTFYNVRFGDSSSNPRWEVFGYRSRYTPLPWRPE